MGTMAKNKEPNIDKTMEELFVVLIGAALIEKTKHDPALNKAARKKVMKEVEKTDLYHEVIVRPSKEN